MEEQMRALSPVRAEGPLLAFAAAVLVSCLLCAPLAAMGGEPPRILVLHSYHKGYGWTDKIMLGVDRVLDRELPEAEVYVEYLDTKRNPPTYLFPSLLPLFREKYRNARFDAIITSDDNALTFLLMVRDELFPGVPVVFCGINDVDMYDLGNVPGFTGVVEDFDLGATIDIALRFHPAATRIYAVSDTTPSSMANYQRLKEIQHRYEDRVEVVHLHNVTTEDLLSTLSGLGPESIILHLNFFRDRDGKTYSYRESIRLVADTTDRPMYVCWDWYLGHGVVGGMITSGEAQGENAARRVLDILAGTPVSDIPIEHESPNLYMFDYKELARQGISLAELPEGSVVINRPPSFYLRFKRFIWAGSLALAALSLVVVILSINIARRRRSEQKLTAIFDNSLVGIMLLTDDRTIAKVNRRITDIFGFSEEELVGGSAAKLHVSDEQYEYFGRHFHERLASRELVHQEYEYRRKDGERIWCIISGKALEPPHLDRGVLWVFDDITERRRAQAALRQAHQELELRVEERTRDLKRTNDQLVKEIEEHRQAEERLRLREKRYYQNLELIFGSLPDAIVTVDDSMRVIEANKAFETITGLPRRTLLGNGISEVLGNCLGPCMRVLKETLSTRQPVKEQQVRLAGERSDQVVELSTSQFLDHEGEFSGVVLEIRDVTRLVELERQLHERTSFRSLIGASEPMQEIYATLENLADFDITVLILGESGTGKELVAEAIHFQGANAEAPFVKVNCSALSESLLESELFGHVRGAFTGAYTNKIGRFEAAEGGTVFLDEIGEISPNIQVKLLRFLERREFERVGESKTIKANVRILAATNADLKARVATGEFREDLYYRLKVMVVNVPPLRERAGDVKLLVDHFVARFRERHDRPISAMDESALAALMRYPWPGNVRELKHAIEHACIVCPGETISSDHLPEDIRRFQPSGEPLQARAASVSADRAEKQGVSRESLVAALEASRWNKSKAARILGISRRHLYRKLEQFHIG